MREHRSTLVFVNTRRLAERVAYHLEERLQDLGPQSVAAHRELSRQIRLSAEERLKSGKTRVVIATASLELGIDVGTIDLVRNWIASRDRHLFATDWPSGALDQSDSRDGSSPRRGMNCLNALR